MMKCALNGPFKNAEKLKNTRKTRGIKSMLNDEPIRMHYCWIKDLSRTIKQCRIFDEEFVAIELQKTNILMNKPITIGLCILDLSKITMYKFLYDFLKPMYGEKCLVAYTDTDTFILSIETPDFYEDIHNNIKMFEISDYPWPNEYNIERKKG